MKTKFVLCLLGLWLVTGAAVALAQDETPTFPPNARTTAIDLDFNTFFLIQNDRDFDRTEPLYDENGQTVGYVTSVLQPGITWTPIEQISLRYSARIGDAVWSRNDAEQRDPAAENNILFQTREMWGRVDLTSSLALRAGYNWVGDPTTLFISRYMGVAEMIYSPRPGTAFSLYVAQFPDSIYETTAPTSPAGELEYNNFENDRILFGMDGAMLAGDHWFLTPGIFALWDKTEIDRPVTIVNPAMLIAARYQHWTLDIHLALQLGEARRAGPNNHDVDLAAGAAEIGVGAFAGPFSFKTTLLAFTADDGDPNDQFDTSFAYSGKPGAETLMLTRNWLYDQYDSLDLRAAAQGAGFFLADEEIRYRPVAEVLDIFGIVGYGRVLDTTNLGDDPTVGVEGDLGIQWYLYDRRVTFTLLGGGLWPGGAGARLKNEIDLDARDPIFYGQGNMEIRFSGL